MARTRLFASQNRQPGTRQVTGVIPDGMSKVRIICDRSSWRGAATRNDAVEVSVDISFDGGATWQFLLGFKTADGETYPGFRRGGQPADAVADTESWAEFDIPQPETPGRRFRATFTNNLQLRSALDIELT